MSPVRSGYRLSQYITLAACQWRSAAEGRNTLGMRLINRAIRHFKRDPVASLAMVGSVASIVALVIPFLSFALSVIFPAASNGIAYAHGPVWSSKTGLLHNDMRTLATKLDDTLSSFRMIVWNRGGSAIFPRDISRSNPITIPAPREVSFVSAEVIHTSRPSLQFSVNCTQNAVTLNISSDTALESTDGVAVRIICKSQRELVYRVANR